jgi:hypothetical protein
MLPAGGNYRMFRFDDIVLFVRAGNDCIGIEHNRNACPARFPVLLSAVRHNDMFDELFS